MAFFCRREARKPREFKPARLTSVLLRLAKCTSLLRLGFAFFPPRSMSVIPLRGKTCAPSCIHAHPLRLGYELCEMGSLGRPEHGKESRINPMVDFTVGPLG